jgi:hypothetical protein
MQTVLMPDAIDKGLHWWAFRSSALSHLLVEQH